MHDETKQIVIGFVELFEFLQIPKYIIGTPGGNTPGGDINISAPYEKLGTPADFTKIIDKFIEDTDHSLEEAKQKRLG